MYSHYSRTTRTRVYMNIEPGFQIPDPDDLRFRAYDRQQPFNQRTNKQQTLDIERR